nr:hypothetical protein [uncultured archaeon]AQS32248.1 hypothetical protein [uncultured archaeon]
MTNIQISIKDVEEQTFKEFKAESVIEGLKIGKALTIAMKFWLEQKSKKPKVSFIELKPKNWGNGTEKTSEEIDKILY